VARTTSTLEISPAKPSEVGLGKRRATSPPQLNDPDVIMISDDDDDKESMAVMERFLQLLVTMMIYTRLCI
jgi:hypothetical protein